MANTSIQLKKSGITGNTPVDLQHGEVAINYADGKLYYKDSLNAISSITNQDSFATINVNSSLVLATSPTDILSINSANDVTLTACTTSKTITIGSNSVAGSYANAAFIQANAAYDFANTLSAGSVDGVARDIANSAFIQANLAYDYANSAHIESSNAYARATFAVQRGNSASQYANSAFDEANSAFSFAGFASDTANASYVAATNAQIMAFDARADANASFIKANSAYQSQNTTGTYANAAFMQANAAFEKANTSTFNLKVGLTDEFDAISNVISNVSQINFDSFTGFKVNDLGSGNVKVSLASSFKTWEVDGQSSLVAHGEDTVRFSANDGIAITTDPNTFPQHITFSASPVFNKTNSAYQSQNTTGVYANAAFMQANAAFNKANTEPTRLYNGTYEVALQPSGLLKTKNIEIDNTIQSGPSNLNTLYMGDTIILQTVDYETQFKVGSNQWTLRANGALEFPDGTLQGTAWTGVGVDTYARDKANSSYASQNTTGVYANSAYTQANTATNYSLSAGSYANSAFVQANTAINNSVVVGSYANSAYTQANTATNNAGGASLYANGAFIQANASYSSQNTTGVYANSAYTQANTATNNAAGASSYANGAFIQANASYNLANSNSERVSGAFIQANSAFNAANVGYNFVNNGGTINGSVVISQDLNVSGNITFGGNSTSISSNNLTLNDSLIYLANNNSGNTVDIGIVGHFIQGNYQHTSVYRDHTDGRWKFVSNVKSEPTTTITLDANVNYDIIKSGGIETTGYANIGTVTYVGTNTGALLGGATNPIIGALGSANGYIQNYVYNSANGISSSSDFAAYPNNGLDSSGWIDMGITSNNYSDISYTVTGRNEGYLFMSAPAGSGTSGNLVIATDSTGTYNSVEIYIGGFAQGKTTPAVIVKPTTFKTNLPITFSDGTIQSTAAASSVYADAAFAKANAAYASQNTTGTYANSAYSQANTATTNAATADSKAVTAGSYANSSFGVANSASTYANGAFVQANSSYSVSNSAAQYANAAFIQANAAFAKANTGSSGGGDKTYTFYQNSAPSTANTHDLWMNSDTGKMYENVNGTTPIWIEFGPTTSSISTTQAQDSLIPFLLMSI